MKASELEYTPLLKIIEPFKLGERTKSAAFLRWFLEHIVRLDETDADDAICDDYNDKGIDGILVSDINEKIYVYQSKIAQNPKKTLGDKAIKEFMGALEQFDNSRSISDVLQGAANKRLKQLIERTNVAALVDDGYDVVGVFVTNQKADSNAHEYLQHAPNISLYDRARISKEYVDLEAAEGVLGNVTI